MASCASKYIDFVDLEFFVEHIAQNMRQEMTLTSFSVNVNKNIILIDTLGN